MQFVGITNSPKFVVHHHKGTEMIKFLFLCNLLCHHGCYRQNKDKVLKWNVVKFY
jgi:hypothetical protein